MSWQLSSHGMCKIVTWWCHWNKNLGKIKIRKISVMSSWTVHEVGPRALWLCWEMDLCHVNQCRLLEFTKSNGDNVWLPTSNTKLFTEGLSRYNIIIFYLSIDLILFTTPGMISIVDFKSVFLLSFTFRAWWWIYALLDWVLIGANMFNTKSLP